MTNERIECKSCRDEGVETILPPGYRIPYCTPHLHKFSPEQVNELVSQSLKDRDTQ